MQLLTNEETQQLIQIEMNKWNEQMIEEIKWIKSRDANKQLTIKQQLHRVRLIIENTYSTLITLKNEQNEVITSHFILLEKSEQTLEQLRQLLKEKELLLLIKQTENIILKQLIDW